MEALKTSGKNIRKGAPVAPIKGGKAGLTFSQLRAIRGMLISYYDSLILDCQHATAYDVNIRLQEVIEAMKEVN